MKTSTSNRTSKAECRVGESLGSASGTPYGKAVLRNACDRVACALEGSRNTTLNAAAFTVSRYVAGGEIDPDTAERALRRAASDSGLSCREVESTLRSAQQAGARKPKSAGRLYRRSVRNERPRPAFPSQAALAAVEGQTRPPTDDDLNAFGFDEAVRASKLLRVCNDDLCVPGSARTGGCALPAYDRCGNRRSWVFWSPQQGHELLRGGSEGLSLANASGLALLREGQRSAQLATARIEVVVCWTVNTFIDASIEPIDESMVRAVFMPIEDLDFLARLPCDGRTTFKERE